MSSAVRMRIALIAGVFLSSGMALGAVKESCSECHSYMSKKSQVIVGEWKQSIHAKKGIGCSGCHGGNPKATTIDGAMWNAPGFKPKPNKQDIPAMCAKCHANPAYMRPFNIESTSQYAEYKQSVHGKRLLEQGDTKVAACTDCHGAHNIRARDDIQSSVYKTNIPGTCAKCHADKDYMKGYGIPTNQYDEYKKSYHGYKLLHEQDVSAPACSDCHGTHGATPPGVKEVPNVCGTCHAKTQEYFMAGPHGASLQATGVPRCVNCHGNHEIEKPSDDMLVGSGQGHCESCHDKGSHAYTQAASIHETITELKTRYAGASNALRRAEAANMDMQDNIAELENAKTNLITARAAQHTVTPGKVMESAKAAFETTASVHKAANAAILKSHFRNNALLAMGLLVIFTCAVLYWKWRLAFERWSAGTE